MVKRFIIVLWALTAGLSFAATASAQTSSTGSPGDQAGTDTTQDSPTADKDIYCPTALEPILPADYYACEARAAYGHEDYKKMLEMLEESASWANKDAQYSLGLAYFNGDMPDVPQNLPLGLAWLALAAERKNPSYVMAYASARAKASPEVIQQAGRLWRQMRLKYGDAVAAPRAVRRFNHAIQPIDDAARDGGIVYLHGFSPYSQNALTIANKLHDEASADFDTWHGSVLVGKPEWVQNPPANAPQAAASPQP
jgi:TPR repeat protein